MSKHVWTVHTEPHYDKIVKEGKRIPRHGFHALADEQIVLIPGVYLCTRCQAVLESNYKPLPGWNFLVQDCDEGAVRVIMES